MDVGMNMDTDTDMSKRKEYLGERGRLGDGQMEWKLRGAWGPQARMREACLYAG
jgi:hypothetical protein